jgi:hypothetical protein
MFHRTFCSFCKAITVHEVNEIGMSCVQKHKEDSKPLFRPLEEQKESLCNITEIHNGTFSMDIWSYSRCIGDKPNRRDALTYFDGLTIEELERISAELNQFLFDRMITKGGLNG